MRGPTLCTAVVVTLLGARPVLAAPGAAKATLAPNQLVIDVSPSTIVKENVRATAALYAASTLEEAKLFDIVDRIADAFHSGQLPIGSKETGERLNAYYTGRSDRVTKATREELGRFATELVRTDLDQRVSDANKQMEAYAALVQAVTDSLAQFRRENTTESQGRDSIADRFPEETWKAVADLARSLSNQGYGAAHFAATKLEQHLRDANTILSDPAVQSAYGVKGQHELIEKLGGKSAPESDRLARRAEAGARLIGSLADNAELLDSPKRRNELARRLAAAAPYAKAWLAVKPVRLPPNVAPRLVRPLCLDDKRSLVRCTVTKR